METIELQTIGFWIVLALMLLYYLATSFKSSNELTNPESSNLCKILYIRSFKDDPSDNDNESFEDFLYSNFKNIGNVVAIGRPHKSESIKRIFKYYFDESLWKGEAVRLMEESYLIILKPNIADSLLWEFQQIIDKRFLNKLIIVLEVGNVRDKEIDKLRYLKYKEFCEKNNPSFKDLLPSYQTGRFIYYKDGTPVVVTSLLNIPRYLIKYFRNITKKENRERRRRFNYIIFFILGLVLSYFMLSSIYISVILACIVGLLSFSIPTNTIGCYRTKAKNRNKNY